MKQITSISFLFLLLGMLSVGLIQAADDQGNPNDPTINDRANACYADGSMAGKCDSVWEWTCGWHIIRLEQGLITREQVPQFCESLVPPISTPVPDVSTEPAPAVTQTPEPQ